MMKTHMKKVILLASLALLLSACGSGSESSTPVTEPRAESTFKVSVASVTVTRLTNGESVEVDTSQLATGDLAYTP